ncbi:hypothetical protein MAQ5080_00888 [Marinomonas aquimarina]|uniref:Uncharacterized protein n=1 Tax=Marinomonas aquimarina TaxID=295068 RepID=A0A1A8T6A7_9GAMM|nr:hypothetical protein MAQ5080_00888 [Marinomonas aquimarina]
MFASIISIFVPKIRFILVFKKSKQNQECPQKCMLLFGLSVTWRKRGTRLMGRACWLA